MKSGIGIDNCGLSNEMIEKIRKVFSKYPQIDSVKLFGSRAMGNFKSSSDIDLVLMGDEIDLSLLTKIGFDLDDLTSPVKFDLSIHHKITNPDMHDHIIRVGIDFYHKEN